MSRLSPRPLLGALIISNQPSGRLRRAVVTGIVSVIMTPPAFGVCLPILDKTLSSLEAQVDQSPSEGFAQAKQLLSDRSIDATPLRKASILTILSSACRREF